MENKAKKQKVSVLIPCHNEELSITKTIESVLGQTRKADQVVVVNDGSSDRSLRLMEQFGDERLNIVDLAENTGNKSYAQEFGLMFVQGDIVIMTDADTKLHPRFIEEIIKKFENPEVAAVAGYVESLKHNWLTACREIDYAIGQSLHKQAQSLLGYIVVIPGCAAAFRTDIFRQYVTFDHDTVAEDLDFTYKLNKKGFKIDFCNKAIVYTQDPADIRSYTNQLKRWYGGNWQNIIKHIKVLDRPAAAAEITMGYLEGLLVPILLVVLALVNVFIFIKAMIMLVLMAVLVTVYSAVVTRRYELMKYPLHYVFVIFINSWMFIYEFIKVVLRRKASLEWFRPVKRANI